MRLYELIGKANVPDRELSEGETMVLTMKMTAQTLNLKYSGVVLEKRQKDFENGQQIRGEKKNG